MEIDLPPCGVAACAHAREELSHGFRRPRAALIERVGRDEYLRLQEEHRRKSVVATVNGYDIRPVVSVRFGRLFMIDTTDTAYSTLKEAKTFAEGLPPAPVKPASAESSTPTPAVVPAQKRARVRWT